MRSDNPLAVARDALRRAHRRIARLEQLLMCIHSTCTEDSIRDRIAAEFVGSQREKALTARRMRVRGEALARWRAGV